MPPSPANVLTFSGSIAIVTALPSRGRSVWAEVLGSMQSTMKRSPVDKSMLIRAVEPWNRTSRTSPFRRLVFVPAGAVPFTS